MSLDNLPAIKPESEEARVRRLVFGGRFEEARDFLESLRASGTPITTLRSYLYDEFMYFARADREKAKLLVNLFEDYGISPWLKAAQI